MSVPTIGRIVLYRLNSIDCDRINRRRQHATEHMNDHRANSNGVQVHVGNPVNLGDQFPMVITRAWGSHEGAAVNGQVMLDGNDLYWVQSATIGDGEGQFSWPVRS